MCRMKHSISAEIPVNGKERQQNPGSKEREECCLYLP